MRRLKKNGQGRAKGSRRSRAKAAPEVEGRKTALLAVDARSAPSRLKNILANTADARIRGHARGEHRAAQGRRDAQQRGEKRAPRRAR